MRPAAAPRRMRRPAAKDEGEASDPGVPGSRPLSSLRMQDLRGLGPVYLSDAGYYGRSIQLAGRFGGTRLEDGELFAEFKVSGTKDDELLRVLSGTGDRCVQVHFCGEDCGGTVTDPLLVHGRSYVEVDVRRLPWLTNLEAVELPDKGPGEDQLADLRHLQGLHEAKGLDDKKKLSKKEKKRKVAEGEGRREAKPDGPPNSKEEQLEVGQKSLKDLFSGTGLDPDPSRRQRILKRAKRLGKSRKKKKKRSSSSAATSSSSSTSSSSVALGEGAAGLFDDGDKLQKIWRRCPGALTAGAVREARQGLLNQAGTLWNISHSELPPLFTQYSRQQILSPLSVSPALTQELLTLSQALDSLLLGKVASTADILCQRIKCVESLAKGCHWTVGRQLELIHSEQFSIAESSEALTAARKAKEEEKLRGQVGRGCSSKGGAY